MAQARPQPESGTHAGDTQNALRGRTHFESNPEVSDKIPYEDCTRDKSQIAVALDRLDYAVEGAQEAFKVLDGRLGIILHPPIPESSDVNRTQSLVPLAADIERYAEQINSLVYQMNQLTQRLGL